MKTILIGNGGSMLKRELGEVIDTYDCVVRMNRCHIAGFERHVGTRTDIWIISMHGGLGKFKWTHASPQPRTIMVYSLSQRDDVTVRLKPLFVDNIEIMPLTVAIETDEFAPGHYPSTGLTAAMMMKPCDIVGFDHWSDERTHYGDDDINPNSHPPERERELFNKLEQLGHIRRL